MEDGCYVRKEFRYYVHEQLASVIDVLSMNEDELQDYIVIIFPNFSGKIGMFRLSKSRETIIRFSLGVTKSIAFRGGL